MKERRLRAISLGIAAALWLLFTGTAAAEETKPSEETSSDGATGDGESDEAFLGGSDTEPDAEGDAEKAEPEETEDGKGEGGEEEGEGGEEEGKWGERKRDHERQGFANILVGTGYFMVVPWDKDDPEKRCATKPDEPNRGEPICSGRSGWHLDMLLGYGLKPGFELFAIFRLGLEQPSGNGLEHQPKVRQVGAGLKIYTPKDGLFKLAFGVAPLFDFSNRGNIDVRPDFVIHVPIAAHFDIFPWFGAYAQVSPNFSFVSEFRLEFTGGIGVQGRFP
jgi:hypothetical protein